MAHPGIVVANTTPLINFAEIDRLELLHSLFGELLVPVAVVAELQAKDPLFPKAAVASQAPFVHTRTPVNQALVATLRRELHAGEAECIALALEEPAALLLLDDVAARSVAEHHGLRFTGTVGCLRLAKQRCLIPAVAPLLNELRTKARFWLTQELVQQVLRDVGEVPHAP
jgi:predicted nucleic acid-binding protein